jgi:hypothetical protein
LLTVGSLAISTLFTEILMAAQRDRPYRGTSPYSWAGRTLFD